MKNINLLSGGAAQGLVTQLEDRFEALHQCSIDASFGAVGMMKDSLLAGAPCDVIILTEALELANLDFSEFLAAYESMTLALASHVRELAPFREVH